jgi:hypothetical protein
MTKTSFEIWARRLAQHRGLPAISDGQLAAELGIHRNRVADYKRGFTTHHPPIPAKPDLRCRLAMAAILAGLAPWPEDVEAIPQNIPEENGE